jgi:hypothetical protein
MDKVTMSNFLIVGISGVFLIRIKVEGMKECRPMYISITLFRVEVGDFRVVERIVVSSSAEVCNWTAGGME